MEAPEKCNVRDGREAGIGPEEGTALALKQPVAAVENEANGGGDEDLRAFTIPEVARMLSLTERQIGRMIGVGQFRVVRVGGGGEIKPRIRIPASSLREFLAGEV